MNFKSISSGAGFLLNAFVIAFFLASVEGSVITKLINVDGSGTSNPAQLLWKVNEIVQANAKPFARLTYRSIGSGAGQNDFLNTNAAPTNTSSSDYGCGDYPLTTRQWSAANATGNPAAQIPYLLNSVSVFHNIPGVGGKGALKLDCRTLASIFNGTIASWSHPTITALNPDLKETLPPGDSVPITVVYRVTGSSSTYGLTNYFNKACPGAWPANQVGPTATNWAPGAKAVANSQEMVAELASGINPTTGQPVYEIGYVESGQGIKAGLKEIALVNAEGLYLTSDRADFSNAYLERILPDKFPASPEDDWNSVNLIAQPGNNTWPITLITFFYVRTDLSWLGEGGGLLKLLLSSTLSSSVAALMPDLGLIPIPSSLRQNYTSYINTRLVVDPAYASLWRVENTANRTLGNQDYVLSADRKTYMTDTLFGVERNVEVLGNNMKLGAAYQVHGSGAYAASRFLRTVMSRLQDMARTPVEATYRTIGTRNAQQELMDYSTNYKQYNHFKVGASPLTSERYSQLAAAQPTTRGVLQLPFAAAAVGVFYNQQIPGFSLRLTPCMLARIYSGEVTMWSDSKLVEEPQGTIINAWPTDSPVLNYSMTVYAYNSDDAHNDLLLAYLAKSCPAVKVDLRKVRTSYDGPITSPEEMAEAVKNTPRSIGFISSQAGLQQDLAEALLRNTAGEWLSSQSANLSSTMVQVFQSQAPNIPTKFTDDWSRFDPLDAPGAGSWPLTEVLFFYAYMDLSPYLYSGPLAKALLNYTISPDAQALLPGLGLGRLPQQLQQLGHSAVRGMAVASLLEEWQVEDAGGYNAVAGTGLFTFSANRASSTSAALSDLSEGLEGVKQQLAAALPAVVHLATSSDSVVLLKQALMAMEGAASAPVKAQMEVLASTQAAVARLTPGAADPVHMAVTDRPLTSTQRTSLVDKQVQVMQVPLFLRAVSLVFTSSQLGVAIPYLQLSACTVAKILTGAISSWSDADIQRDVGTSTGQLLIKHGPSRFRLLTTSRQGGDYQAMRQYAQRLCPDVTLTQEVAEEAGNTTALAKALTQAGSLGALAILSPAPAGTSDQDLFSSLGRVALSVKGRAGTYRSSTQTPASSYAALLDWAVGTPSGRSASRAPSSPAGDWSDFSLVGLDAPPGGNGEPLYPVIRSDMLVFPADLSAAGPSSGAAAGLLSYLISPLLQDATLPLAFSPPALMPLGPGACSYAASGAVQQLNTAKGVQAWPVLGAGQQAPSSSAPAIKLNSLPYLEASGSTESAVLAQAVADLRVQQQELVALVQAMRQQQSDDHDKLKLTYGIAVAGLVLACVLPLVAIAISTGAAARLKRSMSKGAGCLTPTAAGYDRHADMPGAHAGNGAPPGEVGLIQSSAYTNGRYAGP